MPENDTPRAPIYPLITAAEAARRLGISKRTVNRMVADGRMPAIRITAATYRIRPDVIDNLMALTTFVGKAPAAFEERFWRYVDKSGDCWVWAGATNGRYGKISRGVGLGVVGAHRASWEIHFGPIPPDMHVCHRCDNPPCVNPEHLFLGTAQDNNADKAAKGRASGAHRGEHHHRGKLTDRQVEEIRTLVGQGCLHREVAERYGVHRVTVSKIARQKRRMSREPILAPA